MKHVLLAAVLLGASACSIPGPIPGVRPPTKGVGIMFNYPPADGSEPTQEPAFFLRAPNSIVAAGTPIPVPRAYDTVLYEAELVIVIGKRATNVAEEHADDYILGYTAGMDGSPSVTDAAGERDTPRSLFGKSADGVAPVGPALVRRLDPQGHDVVLRVNGEEVDRTNTRELRWKPARAVSELSKLMTLEPGDVIYSGAHRPVPKFRVGDVVEVEVTGIGKFACEITE